MRLGRGPGRIAGIVVAGLALAGCTAEPGPAPTSSGEPPAGALAPTGWQVAPRDDVADGGTLTLPVDALPANYLLYHPDSGFPDDFIISTLSVPSFVTIGTDGGWEADPDYAESLEVTGTDPQVVELRINPDAVWSDGTPITYRDVAATWAALSGLDAEFSVFPHPVWQTVASVERGDDDRDVIITFAQPNAEWPGGLQLVYPEWLLDSPEDAASAWADGPMAANGTDYVSAGAYVVDTIDPDAQVLTFTRNPRWWGDEPKLDTIAFRAVDRTNAGQTFANREIDAVDVYGDADTLASVQGRSDAVVARSLSTLVRQITLNGTAGPFADPAARKAFAVALDRVQLAEAVVGAIGAPAETTGSLVLLPGQRGYTDHLSDELTGSADDALAILADAGYDIGDDGVAAKDGERLDVRFVIPADTPPSTAVAQLVKQQTEPAGFDVEVVTLPVADWDAATTTDTRDFDATYFGLGGSAFPLASAQWGFYPADSPGNLGGVSDERLEDLFAQASADLDPDARTALANEIDGIVTHLFTVIPLFVEPNTWGLREDLANYGPSQFETVRWQDVGFTSE